ncbi:MFS transporter [Niabella sp. 3A5MI-3]|nr:MFS transporter [Niabella beijingensis]
MTEENRGIASLLAFMLIPISGFAMDVYIPSFPRMAADLGADESAIRLTMTVYLISYGLSQLFAGSLIDHFGRYRFGLVSLFLFMITNLVIIHSSTIGLVLVMRAVQGLLISLIMMSKRSLFVDLYEGAKRQHYTSLLSIVWSSAPIIAPFLGGYFEAHFGWRANFWFLAGYAAIMFLLELVFSGETLKVRGPLQPKLVLNAYSFMLTKKDFTLGIVMLGLSYAMVIIFNMAIPFIMENRFHFTAVETGYAALASGLAMLFGGITSRVLLKKDFFRKLLMAVLLLFITAFIMMLSSGMQNHILVMMAFVILLHFLQGFLYNVYFTYLLTRFPQYAGMSGGITSGGAYLVTSVASYAIAGFLSIDDQQTLSASYLILSLLLGGIVMLLKFSGVFRQPAAI